MNSPAFRPRWPEKAALFALSGYRAVLSPLLAMGGGGCRHAPTCSNYSADCIRRHGLWAGGWMTMARLCRCHPLGSSGFDPAPQTKPQANLLTPWKYGDWSWKKRPAETVAKIEENGAANGAR
jgi:uncharacterized protein